MTKENTKAELSILPKGEEARAKFYKRLNEWIEVQYVIESSKSTQNAIMESIAEDFLDENAEAKKGDVKKRAKLIIDEFLKAKATEDAILIDDVLGDYEIASKHLEG